MKHRLTWLPLHTAAELPPAREDAAMSPALEEAGYDRAFHWLSDLPPRYRKQVGYREPDMLVFSTLGEAGAVYDMGYGLVVRDMGP